MSPISAPSKFNVAILPLGDVSTEQIEFLGHVLKWEFGVNTTILPQTDIPARYFIAKRGTYDSHKLLIFLFFKLPDNAQRIVGIAGEVLENAAEKKNCFGSASPYHRVAVYSAPHLSEEKSVDQKIFSYPRIIHEFGHTLGLNHCNQPGCAMTIPKPGIELCARCRLWAERELRVQPGSAEERFSLAESYFQHKDFSRASSTYREAIQLAPHEPLYYHRLCGSLHKLGQFNEAGQALNLAIKYSDDEPDFYYNYALIYLKTQIEKAEGYFTKILAATNNRQKMQRLIGQAYREIAHDVDRASEHYIKYLQLGGNDPDVVEWLESRGKLD